MHTASRPPARTIAQLPGPRGVPLLGNLLQLEQIRWLCEEGADRYDMGPQMDYKRHWTEITTRIEARLLRPKSIAQ